jgi:NADH:ubiquinone oxidoreductase subunit 6 (subunit J)
MIEVGLVVGIAICALLALWAARLLVGVLWLAVSSALLAIFLYSLGAREIAVIELSVGAGLVTVLLVFALNLVGEFAPENRPAMPRPLALGLVVPLIGLLLWLIYPLITNVNPANAPAEVPFSTALWQQRGLDVLVQIALIFAGMVGVVGLLAESRLAQAPRPAEQAQPEVVRHIETIPAPKSEQPEYEELEELTV